MLNIDVIRPADTLLQFPAFWPEINNKLVKNIQKELHRPIGWLILALFLEANHGFYFNPTDFLPAPLP